uniref:Uncharacterized protein n=1 Tax=Zooxanthella nutricula TaxID=1333877 RepID=A0A7S2PWE8_9DINO
MTFADGAASAACLAVAGIACALMSAYFWIISFMDPSLNFMSGLYGAVGIVAYSRCGQAGSEVEPFWWRWVFNEALACVPDDVQMVHRFVATRRQCVDDDAVAAV